MPLTPDHSFDRNYKRIYTPAEGRPIGLRSIDYVRQNPLDVFARLALAENYNRERISPNELHISLPGDFCDHHLTLNWSLSDGLMQSFLVFDFRIPDGRTPNFCELISRLNSRLTVGHFDYWDGDNVLVYRQSHCLPGDARFTTDQAMMMLVAALEAADKAYPACQYFLWAGKSAQDAIETALFDKATRDRGPV